MVRDKKDKVPANSLADAIVHEGLKRNVIFDLSMAHHRDMRFVRNVVKVKPPLTITEEQANKAVDVFEESLNAALKNLSVLLHHKPISTNKRLKGRESAMNSNASFRRFPNFSLK